MAWQPIALALLLGLLVAAGIYLAMTWPRVEPEEVASDGDDGDDDDSSRP